MAPGRLELTVRGEASQGSAVRFHDWSRVDEYKVVFAVEVIGKGLRVVLDTVSVSRWDRVGGLGDFLERLVRDFRGRDGERVWLNDNLGHRDVRLGADTSICAGPSAPVSFRGIGTARS